MNGRYVDVSERAVVSLTGPESLDLLQRISTNDVTRLKENGAVQTVLTNEKGRIVEVVSVLNHGQGSILMIGQSSDPLIMKEWIEKFIIMEDIKIKALTGNFIHFILYNLTEDIGDALPPLESNECVLFGETLASARLQHILGAAETSDLIRARLREVGYAESGKIDYERYRVLKGIPASPNELSLSYNPLEAGLSDLVSFTKGCYVGQEVIARLDSYKKVQRRLVRLRMSELPAELPAKIYMTGQEWGTITSTATVDESHGCRGIGYLKTGEEWPVSGLCFHRGANEISVEMEGI